MNRLTFPCGSTEQNPLPSIKDYHSPEGLFISKGNTKIGPIFAWSLPRGLPKETGGSCIAATPWCTAACYGTAGNFQRLSKKGKPTADMIWYGKNFLLAKTPDFASMMINALGVIESRNAPVPVTVGGRKYNYIMRVHVLGDFFHPGYVKAWAKIARAKPNWMFYGYTRTWRIKPMIQYLMELRGLPNYHLMLSTDPSTGPALSGWNECGVDVAYNRNFKACPYFESGDNKCYKCGYCYGKHGNINVAIKAHSLRKAAVPIHEKYTSQRIARYGFNPLGPEMSVRPRRIPVRPVRPVRRVR